MNQQGDAADFAADCLAYLNDGLDPAIARRLEQALREEPQRRDEFVTLAAMQGLLEDLSSAQRAPRPGQVPRPTPRARAPGSRLRPWLLAAAAVLVLGLTAIAFSRPRVLATVAACRGDSFLTRDLVQHPLHQGDALEAGDAIRVSDHASISCRFLDQSLITLSSLSQVVLARQRLGLPIDLDYGRLSAEVTPQSPGARFQVRTPRALVTVIGTGFTLTADADSSALQVRHGTVALQSTSGGPAIAVHQGERGVVDGAHHFLAQLLPAPSASSITVASAPASARHPFAGNSWWNQPLDAHATSQEISADPAVPWQDFALGPSQLRQVVGCSAADPQRQVYTRGTLEIIGALPLPSAVRLHSGIGVSGFLILIDEQSRVIWECTRPEIKRDGNLAVTALNRLALDGTGCDAGLQGGLLSALPACAGILRLGELDPDAHISHVLALSLPARCLNAHGLNGHAYLAPAMGPALPPAACRNAGNLHLGSRLRLPAGSASALPAGPARNLAEALERYGACIVSISDAPEFGCEAGAAPRDVQLTATLASICRSLQVVTTNPP